MVLSFLISLKGVEDIIKFAGPVLEILYPIMVVLIFMAFFRNIVPNFWFKRGAVIGTVVVSVALAIFSVVGNSLPTWFGSLIKSLPLYNLGFAWLVPAVVCGFGAGFIGMACGAKKE